MQIPECMNQPCSLCLHGCNNPWVAMTHQSCTKACRHVDVQVAVNVDNVGSPRCAPYDGIVECAGLFSAPGTASCKCRTLHLCEQIAECSCPRRRNRRRDVG